MPSHGNRNWGAETVNPQSGRPNLCPGRPLIPKPNSRQCWASCWPNPFPTSLVLAKGPPSSHALNLKGSGQMLLFYYRFYSPRRDTATHELEKDTSLLKIPSFQNCHNKHTSLLDLCCDLVSVDVPSLCSVQPMQLYIKI